MLRAFLLTILVASAARTDETSKYEDARYINDTVTSACRWDCGIPFPDHFWFCFKAGGRVLVGQTIAWKWQYDPTKMFQLRDTGVKLRYDHDAIWVVRTDGKELRLHQDYSLQGFVKSCDDKADVSTP
jgi:hypothetical protein